MIQPRAHVNVQPYASYMGQLAAALRQSNAKTIRFEAAATVRRAMQMQKSSSVAQVKKDALNSGVSRFPGDDGRIAGSTSVAKRSRIFGRQWMIRYDIARVLPMSIWSGKLGPLANHTGQGWRAIESDWTRYKAAWARDVVETKRNIQRRLGARGLTAKSWLEIIEKIGAGEAQGIAEFIRRARPINPAKRRPTGFASTKGEGNANVQVTVINTSGLAIAAGGERKLASAITIRRKFFMDSFNKGFLSDARFVARNYPWAKVS
jgi:hypothetical protein